MNWFILVNWYDHLFGSLLKSAFNLAYFKAQNVGWWPDQYKAIIGMVVNTFLSIRANLHYGRGPWPINYEALETHPKAIPKKIETEICMVMGLQMQCKDIRDRTLIQVLFQYHPIQVGPSTNKLKMKDREIMLMSWSLSFVLNPPIWGGLWRKIRWTMKHVKPCRTHVGFSSIQTSSVP